MRTWDLGRFSVDGAAAAARTALGGACLVSCASRLLAGLGSRPNALHRAERLWARATRRLLGMDLDLDGREYIDRAGQYLILPLHEGFLDAVVVLELGLPVRFVARDELFEWPALGRYLRGTDQIIAPSQPDPAGLRKLVTDLDRTVDAGLSPVIFPQGSVLGLEAAFAPGVFRLVARAGLPVLPVVIAGTHRVWEHPFTNTLRFGCRVSARVLPPVPATTAVTHSYRLEREMKRWAVAPGMAPVRRYVPERDGYWDGYTFEIDPAYPQVAEQVMAHRARPAA